MASIKKFKNANGETRYRARPLVGMRDGKPVQLCKTFPTAKEAKDWAAEQVTLWRKGQGVAGKHTVAELFDDLKRDFKNRGRSPWAGIVIQAHLQPHFGAMRTEQVTSSVLERYVEQRRAAGRADSTIKRELTVLKVAFNIARTRTKKVAVVPHFPRLKEAPPRQGFFEYAEYKAMREALPEEIKPVLAFAYFTGCRRGEILKLKWTQVDFEERLVRLNPGETKNKEGRVIPLIGDVPEMLRMQKDIRDRYWPQSPWVFFRHATGEPLKDFRGAWESAAKKCGLWDPHAGKPNAHGKRPGGLTRRLHDNRRTGVRNLTRAGVPDSVAMAISGHKTRSVFDRYNIVSEADLKDAARRLDSYLQEKQQEQNRVSKSLVNPSPDAETGTPQDARKLLH
jgi:integrase